MNIKKLIQKYKEFIFYAVFGVLTTLVNIAVYWLCRKLSVNVQISTAAAWFVSVLFAYITNRIFVFESERKTVKSVISECLLFFASRIFTGVLDILIMTFFTRCTDIPEIAAKIIDNIIVILLNYILSKLFVFRKNKQKERTDNEA